MWLQDILSILCTTKLVYKWRINYWKLSGDNRLIFGGGENYTKRFPKDIKRFVNNYPDYNIYNVDSLTYAGNLDNLKESRTG